MYREVQINDFNVQTIIQLLVGFINREPEPLAFNLRKNDKIVHYYNEIVRFWNKLNFIIKKIFRSSNSLENDELAKNLYIAYRVLWEKASEKNLLEELKELDKNLLKTLNAFSWDKSLLLKNKKEKFSILEAIPSFTIEHLIPVMSYDFLKKNIRFMNGLVKNTRITVRINNLISKLDHEKSILEIKKSLENDKINYYMDPDIQELFWIPISQKDRVVKNFYYQKGFLIFQDKASAAVAKILSPKPSDKILDMCAAPGTKTSLIAEDIKNKGHIIAAEFLSERIRTMNDLLKHLNVKNTHLINTDSIIFPLRYQNHFDLILLDAPCTGSGNLFNSPELKWRQTNKFLHQNLILQKKLIESALKLLKPKGILVYSTCSLYPEEGELQILDFFDMLEPQEMPKWFSTSYKINNRTIQGTGRLFPSTHQTQGFFIGKFKKKE
ncbi:MAG: RsmB/NOP family class I SAM-dependent RNA methyltransferase [Candidatus Thorarchaeota archaeon]